MMNRWWTSVIIAGAILAAGCGTVRGPTQTGKSEAGKTFVRVSPRDPRYFELTDGTPFIPIGLNIAFPRFVLEEGPALRKMDERMRLLSENGGNFICIWLGHPFYDVEHERSGKYDSRKLRRLDYILNSANRYGIRVKLVLEHFRALAEEAARFPGAPVMGKPIHHVSAGGLAKNMTEFFTLPKSRDRFKKKLAWFADKYRDEPAIFAWQLWNEIDAVRGDGWQDWTREMLAQLHRLFPHHMAVQGMSSLDMYRKRLLFEPLWRMEGNDFAQVSRYIDPGAELEINRAEVDVFLADAVRTARAAAPDKPVVVAETGAVEANHSGPSNLYEKDIFGVILHDAIWAPFFAGAAGTGQIWHWYFYVEKYNLWRHFGRFAKLVKGLDPPAEGFEPGELAHEQLRVYTLRGKKTFLAWGRDKSADRQTDIVEGRASKRRGITIDFNTLKGGVPAGTVRILDPWSGEWTEATMHDGVLELPPFLRSIAIRIDS